MRKLATIRKISVIEPIPGKDRVELATIDGWHAMISKADNFKPGDLVIFAEPDSVFPQEERFEFLKKYNYRIKTQRFKSEDGYVYSQGLVLPLSYVSGADKLKEGDEVTSQLKITQYEETMDVEKEHLPKKKYPKWLMKFGWFRKLVVPKSTPKRGFPSYVTKSDQERCQNLGQVYWNTGNWTLTEKVDGQSGTWVLRRLPRTKLQKFLGVKEKFEYLVCSRNYVIPDKDNSTYWFNSEKYNIREKLETLMTTGVFFDQEFVAFQGENIAPSVQKNKYGVKEPDLYIFDIIIASGKVKTAKAKLITENCGMKFVPIIGTGESLAGKTVDDLLKMADGKSQLCDTLREGIVFRDEKNGNKSFKAVSPAFLFKHGE